MIKKILVFLTLLLLIMAAGCAPQLKATAEPTEVKVTRVVPDPTKPAATVEAVEATEAVVEASESDACVECHTNKDLLIEIAVEPEAEEESEGVG